ncbi:MAG TPA: iron-containing alcohol dehydrogenase, partial [Sinomonas sp.]|nr:iron-containing alcohol dehydrogenase [Sinomonas sp.]
MHELRRLLLEAHREGHSPQVIEGVGASSALGAVVDRPPRQVLVVASPRTALQTPAVAALVHSGAHHYRQTPPNPTVDDALALSHAIDSLRPSAILAVGGGSALDLAKAGRLLKPDPSLLDSGLAGHPRSLRAEPPRLIAVPTTAGTGAEITPFATLYRGRSKVSLDTPACRPDLAVLDGLLTLTCPDGPSLAAALDAMCHSIESGWNLRGTPSSRVYADSARDHLLASLARCEPPSAASPRWASGRSPATASWRHLMLLAAAVA